MEDAQQPLPFGLAEADYADRKNRLAAAINRLPRDLHLAQFCWLVFHTTDGGTRGEMKKTREQLAGSPLLLWCSVSKVKATLAKAVELRLVSRIENRSADGGQDANSFQIDWDGVSDLLDYSLRPGQRRRTPQKPPVATEPPPVATEPPPVATEPPPVATEPHIRKYSSLTPSCKNSGRPGRPTDFDESKKPRDAATERDRWVERAGLTEQAAQVVSPLPTEWRQGSVFSPIGLKTLEDLPALVNWHRRQLSAPRPVLGATAAELVLALAAALHARRMPARQVRSTRVAVWVNLVHKREIDYALPLAAAAAKLLGAFLNVCPDALTSTTWPTPSMLARSRGAAESELSSEVAPAPADDQVNRGLIAACRRVLQESLATSSSP